MGKDGHFLSFLAAVGVSLTKDCCKCLTKFSQGWRGRRCLGQPEFNLLSWGQDLWLSEEFLYIFLYIFFCSQDLFNQASLLADLPETSKHFLSKCVIEYWRPSDRLRSCLCFSGREQRHSKKWMDLLNFCLATECEVHRSGKPWYLSVISATIKPSCSLSFFFLLF